MGRVEVIGPEHQLLVSRPRQVGTWPGPMYNWRHFENEKTLLVEVTWEVTQALARGTQTHWSQVERHLEKGLKEVVLWKSYLQ